MKILETKLMTVLRAGALALLLVLFAAGPVTAQDATEAPVSAQVEDDLADDDDGFDWGLLGLLGLAGLAGLLKRPEREVRTTDRNVETRR